MKRMFPKPGKYSGLLIDGHKNRKSLYCDTRENNILYPYSIEKEESFENIKEPQELISLCENKAKCEIAKDVDIKKTYREKVCDCDTANDKGCPLLLLNYKEIKNKSIGFQEIFAHKDHAILDTIINNFYLLKGQLDVPVKLGHDEDQKLIQNDGYPSAGWVSELKRQGDVLLGEYVDVPEMVIDLIESKRFKNSSSEISPKYKVQIYSDFNDTRTETNIGPTLRAVSILGENIPKIKGLKDLAIIYNKEDDSQKTMYLKEHDKMKTKVKNIEDLETDNNIICLSEKIQKQDDIIKVLVVDNKKLTDKISFSEKFIEKSRIVKFEEENKPFYSKEIIDYAKTIISFKEDKSVIATLMEKIAEELKISKLHLTESILDEGDFEKKDQSNTEIQYTEIEKIEKEKKISFTEAFDIWKENQ